MVVQYGTVERSGVRYIYLKLSVNFLFFKYVDTTVDSQMLFSLLHRISTYQEKCMFAVKGSQRSHESDIEMLSSLRHFLNHDF